MALQKSVTLGTGVSGDYWRVASVSRDALAETSSVKVELYKDAAARTSGKDPLQVDQYEFDGAEFPFSDSALTTEPNLLILAYDKLKTLDAFSGASDV